MFIAYDSGSVDVDDDVMVIPSETLMTLHVILSARWELAQADRITRDQDVDARDFRAMASTMIGAI